MESFKPPLAFEILIHSMEFMVVIGIVYTIYFLKRFNREKQKKNESKHSSTK